MSQPEIWVVSIFTYVMIAVGVGHIAQFERFHVDECLALALFWPLSMVFVVGRGVRRLFLRTRRKPNTIPSSKVRR